MVNLRFSMRLFASDRHNNEDEFGAFDVDFFYATPASDWYLHRDCSDPFQISAEIERIKSLRRITFELRHQSPASGILKRLNQTRTPFRAAMRLQVPSSTDGAWREDTIDFHDAVLVNFRPSSFLDQCEEGYIRFRTCSIKPTLN